MTDNRGMPILWAKRLRPALIRRLYETDSRGIVEEELIDEVGCALLARCETIRRVTERRCPHCGHEMAGARDAEGRMVPEAAFTCGGCGFETTWRAYRRSYTRTRTHGGRAYPEFIRFMDDYPRARTPAERMICIDALIHALHQDASGVWSTPAATNLIEGKHADIMHLLDSLAYGDAGTPGLREAHGRWARTIERSESATRQFYLRRGADAGQTAAKRYIRRSGQRPAE